MAETTGRRRTDRRNDRPPLTRSDLESYGFEWQVVRARFRRQPGVAIAQADDLVRRMAEGGPYSRPDDAAWSHTLQLGVLLSEARRRDLKPFFEHYRTLIEAILAGASADEIELEAAPSKEIDLRVTELSRTRPAIRGGKHA